MKHLKICIIFLTLVIVSCGAQPPKKLVNRNSAKSVNVEGEFANLLQAIDNLGRGLQAVEQVPQLIMERQVRIYRPTIEGRVSEESLPIEGRCMLFLADGEPFISSELADSSLELSPAGRLVFSRDTKLSADSCQELFRDQLDERFQTEFFSLHSAFFRY